MARQSPTPAPWVSAPSGGSEFGVVIRHHHADDVAAGNPAGAGAIGLVTRDFSTFSSPMTIPPAIPLRPMSRKADRLGRHRPASVGSLLHTVYRVSRRMQIGGDLGTDRRQFAETEQRRRATTLLQQARMPLKLIDDAGCARAPGMPRRRRISRCWFGRFVSRQRPSGRRRPWPLSWSLAPTGPERARRCSRPYAPRMASELRVRPRSASRLSVMPRPGLSGMAIMPSASSCQPPSVISSI